MKKSSENSILTNAQFILFFICCISISINAQNNMFSLVRKIKVDHQGKAGACDGSAFNTKGDIIQFGL